MNAPPETTPPLDSEQLAAAWCHLQAWVQVHRADLPPLSRIGAAAGLTRTQARTLLTGRGNRTARTAQRLQQLQDLLKKHSYNPSA